MTGITAEKHDGFITPAEDGKAIMEFSGKELIKGEPDASSFPSGGLRATFEARGYTAWDPTSYAFIKDGTPVHPHRLLLLQRRGAGQKDPAAALDGGHQQPGAAHPAAVRQRRCHPGHHHRRPGAGVFPDGPGGLLQAPGPDATRGRTLFGAPPPKGQELEDHYFGVIQPRVAAFMTDLDEELWKLGIPAKTEHNEVAPAQHELAPIFTTANMAVDHNQLTMEIMKKVANRHGLVCLLHEKPFDGVNGSRQAQQLVHQHRHRREPAGPRRHPHARTCSSCCSSPAIIKAVDDYAGSAALLRRQRGQRPPSGRSTRRLPPSSPSSWATSWTT